MEMSYEETIFQYLKQRKLNALFAGQERVAFAKQASPNNTSTDLKWDWK